MIKITEKCSSMKKRTSKINLQIRPTQGNLNIIEFHYNNATNKAALLSLWSLYIEVVKMSFSFNKNSGITWEIELWVHWVCNRRNVRRWSHVNHFHFNNSQLVTSTDGEIIEILFSKLSSNISTKIENERFVYLAMGDGTGWALLGREQWG